MPKKKPKRKTAGKRPKKVVDYAVAKRALSQNWDTFNELPGVVGTSVGPRFKDGKPTREMTIRLHVASESQKKTLKKYLEKHAEKIGLKKQYGDVGIDIVVWKFKPAFELNDVADGSRISGVKGFGTLGTRGTTTINSDRTVVWLTAAHVASPDPPQSGRPVEIKYMGEVIGTVAKEHYFRGIEVDAAYIVPSGGKIQRSRPRLRMKQLTGNDMNTEVTLSGAQTQNSVGKIISLDYDGPIVNSGETVTDHFLVQSAVGNFAIPGDSGAIVFQQSKVVGILRAVDTDQRISVVTKFVDFSRVVSDLDQGFRL